MTFLLKHMIIPTLVAGNFGNIITGPPSHGDYVFCLKDNVQIVLSGGLCKTSEIGSGPSRWGYVNNNDVQLLYTKLLSFSELEVCGSFYDKYHLVGIIDGCMISSSNTSIINKLIPLLSDNWVVNKFQKSSGYSYTHSLSYYIMTLCTFFPFIIN